MNDPQIKQTAQVDIEQQEVYDFLRNPQNYPDESADCVDVISTHCALLFLCGESVYKIKRAVTYSYLDMATLEKRGDLCRREYEINYSQLPDIYLGVVAVTRQKDGSLAIDGGGEIVEWALHMHRFDENTVLDNMAKSGELTNSHANAMGQSIADYHKSLINVDVQDGAERIGEVVHELIDELRLVKTQFTPHKLQLFKAHGVALLNTHRTLLNQRANNGFIKRCHGDLHLRNLVLRGSIPVPFDALEFDERLATIDVMYDLAFLLMDLDYRGLGEQKNLLLNSYLLHSDTDNLQALALLPLFLFCRAGIKAMTSAQAASHSSSPSSRVNIEAEKYLDLALSYLDNHKQMLVSVGGISGSGKTTAAVKLMARMDHAKGVIYLRSDAERKAHWSVSETQRLPQEAYSRKASTEIYQILFKKVRLALDAGYTVIVDAVFLTRDVREAMDEIADVRNIPFYGYWLDAQVDVLKQRIEQRSNDASDATVDVMLQQRRQSTGENDWIKIDAAGDTLASLRQMLLQLSEKSNLRAECDVI